MNDGKKSFAVLVKREQKHKHILIYWGENLLSFLSLWEGRRTRREHDDERAYDTQNKTNVPLGGGIFELSSNWWSFAFLIGTNCCCARRWTTGRQTWLCVSSRVIFVWGDYRKEHKNNNSPPEPKREIFRFGGLGLERQKNTRIW